MEAKLAAGAVWTAKLAWNLHLRVFAAGSRQCSPAMKLDRKSEPLFPKPTRGSPQREFHDRRLRDAKAAAEVRRLRQPLTVKLDQPVSE
jgi:hypothetical protein